MQTLLQAEDKPLGVIESLQQGFNVLNRRAWLLLPPVLLDLFLWLGPKVNIGPVVDAAITAYESSMSQAFTDAPPEVFQTTLENLRNLSGSYNLLSLLAGMLASMPSLFARLEFHAVASPLGRVITLQTWQSMFLLMALLLPLGILIGSFWLALIAFTLSNRPLFSFSFVRRWGWVWINANLYLILLFIALIMASLFFGVVAALLMALGQAGQLLLAVMWLLFLGFSVWLNIGLYFVMISVALDDVNLARAIWRSLNVVGRNAMSTLGFLILTLVLMEGFARIWARLSLHPWGVILGIMGNAYLGAAITLAAFLFYQSRYQHWRQTRALLLLQQQEKSHRNEKDIME